MSKNFCCELSYTSNKDTDDSTFSIRHALFSSYNFVEETKIPDENPQSSNFVEETKVPYENNRSSIFVETKIQGKNHRSPNFVETKVPGENHDLLIL